MPPSLPSPPPIKVTTPPSGMSRSDFIAAFGDVFEHSAWVAEETHAAGLNAACDTAAGLADAMQAVFRRADSERQLATLKAHPDLAGRLAATGALTRDSAAEQSGAGLDTLTRAEREAFNSLNADYTAKFGFPFIIAARDYDKAAILKVFNERLNNDPDAEFATACKQVERIAELRIAERMGG